ncbi:MAG TPA: alpha-L-glutamate ligase-like protein [Sulfurovum sp.]|nr:alpha-L-glutamate ligase-like protein [Sulfurovum sp.]
MFFANPFKLKKLGVLGMNKRNVYCIGEHNDRKQYPLVDDKLKTKVLAENVNIAVPKLLGTVSMQSEVRNIEKILEGLDGFVIKPAQGSGGKGILVIVSRKDDFFFKPSGEHVAFADIRQHISNTLSGLYSLGGKPDVAMIEQLVQFDPIFDKYSFEGVPDIRIILYKGFPAMAMLRCSTKESDGKANLHQGAVGVGIDITTGKALSAVQHNKPVLKHPDTGYDFSELSISHWQNMLDLAARCYDMTQLGYLGVDIVIDKHLGPLILELNARPGLAIQIANQTGILTRFDVIDKAASNMSSDARVNFTLEHFGKNIQLEFKL